MKATGIVRRIDELGRVVIPKEIRRTLRIREGDPLEIFTDRDGEVILKKYSPIGELSDFSKEYTESLYHSMGHVACICDKDTVVSVAGTGKRELLDKAISLQLEQLINERKKLAATKGAGFISITQDEEESMKYHAQVIVPIITEGDAIGAVILLSKDEGVSMGEAEIKVAETAAQFIGKQMEQ
ncbi:MAG: stage V sporulation protein T [Christensenellales bacterium]|jgi:AbrB family transcriptional regulator (stage V sporulation protein T)